MRRLLAALALLVAALVAAGGTASAPTYARAQDLTLFRIGTGGAGGTYYPIGSLIAQALSNPPGSGTLVEVRIILEAYGLSESDVESEYIKPQLAAERMLGAGRILRRRRLSRASVAELVAIDGCELVPIAGPQAQALLRKHRFFSRDTIPSGTYGSLPAVATLSGNAQWITRAELDEELVYQITKTLWHDTTTRLLHGGHAKGLQIAKENALAGVGVPLHPGAERYYREAGLLP